MKHTINDFYFNEIDTEDKAYFLGLLYADGCIVKNRNRISIKLQEQDKHILDTFLIYLNYSKPLVLKKYSEIKSTYNNQYLLYIDNKNIRDNLILHGCVPNKSQLIRFPNIKKSLLNHFIRGYFDGDGSVFNDKYGNMRFSLTSNLEFLESIQNILVENCNLNTTKICKTGNVYSLHYGGNKLCNRIKKFLYKDATIYLKRKKLKFDELPDNY